jgi:type I restriction enzyme S subunit
VLQEYLSTAEGRRALRARCKTSAGQFNINTEGLGSFPIPSFPMPLQELFIRQKKTIEQQQAIHRESLTELDTLFASLQHRAFSGEL